MVIWKQLRRLHIALPEELVAELDEGAKEYYMSRTEYIRFLLHECMTRRRKQQGRALLSDDPDSEAPGINPLFLDIDDS